MGRRPKQESNGSSKNPLRVNIQNRQKDLSIPKLRAKEILEVLIQFLKISCEEISLYFVTEKEISSLHEQFFDDPTPTDCIAFPIDEKYLGDLFVCPKTAIAYAKKKDLDPYTETLLYVVHSFLHLCGYCDLTPQKRRDMRKMEKKCMDHLREKNLQLKPQ